jgi:hypothetical protein
MKLYRKLYTVCIFETVLYLIIILLQVFNVTSFYKTILKHIYFFLKKSIYTEIFSSRFHVEPPCIGNLVLILLLLARL